MDKRPIGMFDSGVGGMTVFSEIMRELPNEDIIYLGDTKRFPYGNKSKESIIEISKQAVEFLISKNVKYIIIACGTATSQAIEILKSLYDIPIMGIIEPTVQYIEQNEKIKNLGVIATTGTIKSNAWEIKIKEKRQDINIINKACPVLANLAEEGWSNNQIAEFVLREYLQELHNIDALVLGCTHYPMFKDKIRKILGEEIELINTGEKLGKYFKNKLEELNLNNEISNKAKYQIYLSDTESNFIRIANNLLNNEYIIKESEIVRAEL